KDNATVISRGHQTDSRQRANDAILRAAEALEINTVFLSKLSRFGLRHQLTLAALPPLDDGRRHSASHAKPWIAPLRTPSLNERPQRACQCLTADIALKVVIRARGKQNRRTPILVRARNARIGEQLMAEDHLPSNDLGQLADQMLREL